MALGGLAGNGAALFGIYVAVAYDVMSATNSSPQTTELFAQDRADTLWKYVKLGDIQIIGFGVFGAILAPKGEWMWPLLGAVAAGAILHAMYRHALKSGNGEGEAGQTSALKGVAY